MESAWMVLRTKGRHEKAVESVLNKRQINCYLPKRKELKTWKGRRAEVVAPLFPGYIFVRPSSSQMYDLTYIPGSCGLLRFNNQPAQIEESEITQIDLATRSGRPLEVHPTLFPGEKVRVIAGPLKGLEGCLALVKSNMRVVLNTYILNQSVCINRPRRSNPDLKLALAPYTIASHLDPALDKGKDPLAAYPKRKW